MKKAIYITPLTRVRMIQGEELLNSISNPTGTNTPGLGVGDDPYEDEGHAKSNYNVWNDDWNK